MKPIINFFSSASEIMPGILLCCATVLALIFANTQLSDIYQYIFNDPYIFGKSLQFVINDGLMVIFFLLIGLEVKREIVTGHLNSLKNAALPLVAATGGAIVPALIFSAINWGDSAAMKGWAIPTATDIAFALGILMMLRHHIPNSIKVCLVTIAVIDDLFAVIIIALFYTSDISFTALLLAAVGIIIAIWLNRRNVTSIIPYIIIGFLVWACVLKSGIHPTLAGVAMGLIVPIKTLDKNGDPPAEKLEHLLHPWVSFMILPIFAFANAGISFSGINLGAFSHPITLGIMLGLFVGKQAGIMLATKIACSLKIAELPVRSTWPQYYGMALLTGIGFTMSLFIGNLAFTDGYESTEVKLGVLCGSFLSACAGILCLLLTKKTEKAPD